MYSFINNNDTTSNKCYIAHFRAHLQSALQGKRRLKIFKKNHHIQIKSSK